LPRYDYECGTCHHEFEMRQSFNSDPVAICPQCGNGTYRKIHAVPVVFKGSGWYVNDYGKRSTASTSASSKDSSDSNSKSEKPGDESAPAAKKEATSTSGSGKAKAKDD